MNEDFIKRFWNKVSKTESVEDCWNWIGAFRGDYGAIKLNKKVLSAHRSSFMIANPTITLNDKDYICHKCDNPKCVNPNHLFLGDHSLNMKDAFKKNRIIVPEGKRFKKGHIPKNKKS